MKQLPLLLSLLLSLTCFAQSEKYAGAMQNSLQQMNAAESTDNLTQVAASFKRIGDAEKTQWLPYYYAALATLRKGFSDNAIDKDQVATAAEADIAKAEALAPNNAEVYLLKSMAATLHMLVDPMSRWQQYGQQVNENREKAKQLDPENPRVYFLEAQNIYGTPQQFGGGKDAARPVFEKAVALYETYKPASNLHPNWGKTDAVQMLEKTKN